MITYQFDIHGTAYGGQTWSTTGRVAVENPGNFPEVLNDAQRQSFMQLTGGRAVFGKPGIGCRGPYTITSFAVTLVPS